MSILKKFQNEFWHYSSYRTWIIFLRATKSNYYYNVINIVKQDDLDKDKVDKVNCEIIVNRAAQGVLI